jgi:GT2 family glycosyltransferase
LLGDLLNSLSQQRRPADEVILVDNASSDDSVAYVQQHFPWVQIVPLKINAGFAEGNNIGIEHTSSDYVALLNSDTVLMENCLSEMCEELTRHPEAGAVVPKIYRIGEGPVEPPVIECAGAEFNNLGFCWGRGASERDLGQFDSITEVPALTGCAALLRRSALAGEPPFDPRLFMYYEELELSLRLRGRGHTIIYTPAAVVHHKGAQSVKRTSRRPILFTQFFGNRNRVKILAKYYPLAVLLRSLPLIWLSLAYWNSFFLISGGPILFVRALGAQVTYGVQGFMERMRGGGTPAAKWLSWMTNEGISELLARRSAFKGYAA